MTSNPDTSSVDVVTIIIVVVVLLLLLAIIGVAVAIWYVKTGQKYKGRYRPSESDLSGMPVPISTMVAADSKHILI